MMEQAAPAPNNTKLPADEEGAKARLSASPRHSEWVKIDVTGGTPLNTFVAQIKAPVLGLYGGADARIGATIPATEAKMKALGKSYEPHTFEGAGHGFLRAQTGQNGANMKASEQAWPMTAAFIRKNADSGASKSQ